MKNPTVEKQTFKINGVDLTFKRSGRGFPLVLLHTFHPFAKQILSSLASKKDYQVLTVDIPGYYSPGQPKSVTTINQFITLLDKLFESLSFQKVDLLGECLGSVIALKFATKYPQRVRRLIVVSLPFRIFDPKVKKPLDPVLSLLKNNKIAGGFAKLLLKWNLWRWATGFLGGYQGFWEVFKQETLLVSKFNFDQKVFFGILSDLFKTDINKVLGKLKSGTLFVCGEKDKMTKKKEIVKFCREHQNASYAFIPQASHALVSKNTKEFNQVVCKFLLEK